jgi:hypothetical protein
MTVAQFWNRSRHCQMLDLWAQHLDIRHLLRTHPISRWQVTGPDGHPGASLVGVVERLGIATIFHTRRLREDDIVHELLHVRFPELSHDEVEFWTNALCSARRLGAINAAVKELTAAAEAMQFAAADAAG